MYVYIDADVNSRISVTVQVCTYVYTECWETRYIIHINDLILLVTL